MKLLMPIALLLIAACCSIQPKQLPISNGNYKFKLRFSEHPNIQGPELDVYIYGNHVKVVNNSSTETFLKGTIETGELFWHASSGNWIIVQRPSDESATEVGGCSDGPTVIDLKNKIYWTC